MAKEAIVIILDIGHSSDKEDSKLGFLENAIECVSMILKRKILSKSKDEIALVLLGSTDTDNSLDYKNIRVSHPLCLPSWEMLHFVEKELSGTKENADWLDAVVVGMNILRQETQGKKFTEKKLVLLTDLDSRVSDDQIDIIIKNIQSEATTLVVIGPDININIKDEPMDEDDNERKYKTNGTVAVKPKTRQQLVGEALLSRILSEAGGVICSFAEAVPQLMFFQKRNVRPTPFNVVMDIGPDIKIAVSGYRKIMPASLPTWKTTSSTDKGARIETEKSYIRQDENQTVVEMEDVIEGFSFGTTLVPFSGVDKAMMNYQSGDKCLSVLGFTKSSNVPRHLFLGNGVLYFTAQKGDDSAAVALSSLINALDELDLVAIARKVYRTNTAPKLGALFPRVTSSYECLVFVELPFSEDMREFVFPPLVSENNQPSKQQLDSIDALIDNMDLTVVKNEHDEVLEAFKPKSMLNPYHQHVYHTLAYRAMNEDSELPPVNNYIMDLLKSPFTNKPSYKLSLEEIKKQFSLAEVKPKATRKVAAEYFKKDVKDETDEAGPANVDLSGMTMANLVQTVVLQVGTVDPDQDFKTLLERGEDFSKVCVQMQKAIVKLVIHSFGTDNFDKAEKALRTLRTSCLEKRPSVYNDWIAQFRDNLFERGKKAFWDLIVEGKLGLITFHESDESTVTDDEAKKFLEYEETKEEEASAPEDDMDADDLLNQM